MKLRRGLCLGIVACVTLSLSNASAQPTSRDKAIAIQLFEEAEQLMAGGNPGAACPKYSESQKRDPQLGTLLQLADCHERIGKTASAWAGYKEAAEIAARRNAAGSSEPREAIARARAAALETKLARLMVIVTQTDVASLEIRQDGELLGRGACPTLDLTPQEKVLEFMLLDLASCIGIDKPPPPPPQPPPPPPPRPPGD